MSRDITLNPLRRLLHRDVSIPIRFLILRLRPDSRFSFHECVFINGSFHLLSVARVARVCSAITSLPGRTLFVRSLTDVPEEVEVYKRLAKQAARKETRLTFVAPLIASTSLSVRPGCARSRAVVL